MDKNEKMLLDLAGQVGFSSPDQKAVKRAEGMAKQYEGKSEDAILKEIVKLKDSMKSDRGQYEKQIKAIRSLRSIMSAEQRARLDQVIQLLED